jgi:hypothetical protein
MYLNAASGTLLPFQMLSPPVAIWGRPLRWRGGGAMSQGSERRGLMRAICHGPLRNMAPKPPVKPCQLFSGAGSSAVWATLCFSTRSARYWMGSWFSARSRRPSE